MAAERRMRRMATLMRLRITWMPHLRRVRCHLPRRPSAARRLPAQARLGVGSPPNQAPGGCLLARAGGRRCPCIRSASWRARRTPRTSGASGSSASDVESPPPRPALPWPPEPSKFGSRPRPALPWPPEPGAAPPAAWRRAAAPPRDWGDPIWQVQEVGRPRWPRYLWGGNGTSRSGHSTAPAPPTAVGDSLAWTPGHIGSRHAGRRVGGRTGVSLSMSLSMSAWGHGGMHVLG